MRVIEQESESSVICEKIKKDTKLLLSHGFGDELILDKLGAKQLIEVLKEFINDSNAS